ncbi:MAG TPA: hypothetical protein VI451_18450, partial [Anaerolineales bacterium]|nr:hypothetical protein [Anaerolineales bacterium]
MKRLLPLLLFTLSPLLLFTSSKAQTLPPEGLPIPQIVAIAGTFQDDLGCPGEWNTDCENTYLALDSNSLIWRASFQIPAGSHEYKVALNGSWADNFGLSGEYYGPNIPLELEETTLVTFYY